MRKIIYVFLILAIVLSGCSSNSNKKEIIYFSDEVNVTYTNFEEFEGFEKSEEADSDCVEKVNLMNYDVCRYLNDEYKANWNTDRINVYKTNVEEYFQNTGLEYYAVYFDGGIYIDSSFIIQDNSLQNEYVLVHELIHFLFDINTHMNKKFCLFKEGKVCGNYLEEAIVDYLAKKYILDKYPVANSIQVTSKYKYIRMYIELIEIGQPDFLRNFFNGDLETMQKDFNKYSKKYVKCEGDPFEKWLLLIDKTMFAENEDDLSEVISIEISFTTVLTPKEKKERFFFCLEEITEIDRNELQKHMH